jgi:hypothetical protein
VKYELVSYVSKEFSLNSKKRQMKLVKSMSTSEYELLKCEGCGKRLGYIRISVKIFPLESLIRLSTGGPLKKIQKTAFCEECFRRKKTTDPDMHA